MVMYMQISVFIIYNEISVNYFSVTTIIYTLCKFKMKMPLCTNLDAYQSISLFGWWNQPRMLLTWNDVKVYERVLAIMRS